MLLRIIERLLEPTPVEAFRPAEPEEYEELMRLRALAAHRELVRALGQEAEKQGLSEEQLLAEYRREQGLTTDR